MNCLYVRDSRISWTGIFHLTKGFNLPLVTSGKWWLICLLLSSWSFLPALRDGAIGGSSNCVLWVPCTPVTFPSPTACAVTLPWEETLSRNKERKIMDSLFRQKEHVSKSVSFNQRIWIISVSSSERRQVFNMLVMDFSSELIRLIGILMPQSDFLSLCIVQEVPVSKWRILPLKNTGFPFTCQSASFVNRCPMLFHSIGTSVKPCPWIWQGRCHRAAQPGGFFHDYPWKKNILSSGLKGLHRWWSC